MRHSKKWAKKSTKSPLNLRWNKGPIKNLKIKPNGASTRIFKMRPERERERESGKNYPKPLIAGRSERGFGYLILENKLKEHKSAIDRRLGYQCNSLCRKRENENEKEKEKESRSI